MRCNTYSLSQLGVCLFESLEDYNDGFQEDAIDELILRCPEIDKAQHLFNYHAEAYRKVASQKHFYECFAMLCLVGELSARRSQAGGES